MDQEEARILTVLQTSSEATLVQDQIYLYG